MIPRIPRDVAVGILEPFFPALHWCISDGVERFRPVLAEGPFSKRTHSSGIHDLIIENALARLKPMPGVEHVPSGQLHLFVIGDDVAIRFKKFRDDRLMSSGILTQQRLDLLAQDILGLPGIPQPRVTIELGYKWADPIRDIYEIYAACPLMDKDLKQITNLWVMRLRPEEGGAASELVPFTPISPEGLGGEGRILPRVRRENEAEQEGADGG